MLDNTHFLLHHFQKHKLLSDAEIKLLKKKGLIEGRKPNYYISDRVVTPTDDTSLKAEYIKNRNFDDNHYRTMILQYISKYHSATKKDIKALILDKLSPVLSSLQKESKVQNLLSSLRIAGKIEYKDKAWVLKK